MDADGDGVLGGRDACPEIPGVASPNASDNGCPPKGYYGPFVSSDIDGDRIDDMVDACPRLAGEPADNPDRHGCPAAGDQDSDGITDVRDACIRAPGPPSPDPKRAGCPLARLVGDEVVLLDPISFETGSGHIRAESAPTLDAVAEVLKRHPRAIEVSIEGHTDDQGWPELNRRLSLRRAESVVGALTARGVDQKRLLATGFGPAQPIASNDTEAGRALNRRVEIRVVRWENTDPDTRVPTPTPVLSSGLDAPEPPTVRPQLVPMQDPGFDRPVKTPSTPMLPIDDPGLSPRK